MTNLSISAVAQSILAIAKADAAKTILPLIVTFTNSIATNPSAVNVAAQVAAFQFGAVAALPGLAQAELVALAGLVNAEAQALLAPVPAAA